MSSPPPVSGPGGRSQVGRPPDGPRRPSLATLLEHLHVAGPLTRAELTGLMGVNRSTVAASVAELSALGAVVERGPARASGGAGRPSIVVSPVASRLQVLAAQIAVEHVTVALVGLGGHVARRRVAPTPSEPGSPEQIVTLLGELVHELAPEHTRAVGMGVAVPGAVRRTDGCVRFAPNLGWTDEPFGRQLAQALPGLHVVVGNDADLGVLAEHRRGVARGIDDVVFVTGDVGVGGGLVLGGVPLLGAGGYAGELGHMTVRPDGPACRCGARGCWETQIGAPAIARALGAPAHDAGDLSARIRQAGAGAPNPAIQDVARWLGVGIGNVVNLVNPRLVILGGVLRAVLEVAADGVRAALDATALRATAEQVRLEPAQLGADAVLAGAAEVVWQDLLADPVAVLQATG